MRAGTAFVVTLALLLGLGVAADALVTRSAEQRAAERASQLLGAPAEVTLAGWPVALRLLAGRVPEMRVLAEGVPAGGVALRRIDVRLEGVRVRLGDLDGTAGAGAPARPGDGSAGAGSPGAPLRATRGSFVAELDAAAVGTLLGMPDAVRFGEGIGHVRVGDATVDVAVSLEEGRVVLRPIGAAPEGMQPLTLELPALPGGPTIDDVRISGGALRLVGRVSQLEPAST